MSNVWTKIARKETGNRLPKWKRYVVEVDSDNKDRLLARAFNLVSLKPLVIH